MVGFTPGHFCQRLGASQCFIEEIALLLRARILPVRAMRMSKSASPLPFAARLELLDQALLGVEPGKKAFGILRPEDSSVLHAGSREAPDSAEVHALLVEARQDEVHSLQPHCVGREDLALGRVGEHAFVDAILAQVVVEVDLGLVYQFQVRADGNAWSL